MLRMMMDKLAVVLKKTAVAECGPCDAGHTDALVSPVFINYP